MSTNTCSINGRLRTDETVSARLSTTHDEWINEARQFLLPATAADAPFWDRWSAVRYLNDQYMDRYRAEQELVAELRPFIPVREHEMLTGGGERLVRLWLALDRVGRRRGTALEFARATSDLLKALELWCAEIEHAGSRVETDALPPEARRLLDHLVASPRMCSLATA